MNATELRAVLDEHAKWLRGEADSSRADLSGVSLSGVSLSEANLYGADLSRADLYEANGAELAIAQTRILPEGQLIGWKKCQGDNGDSDVIVKLCIPADARRSSAFGRKCRAEYVDVLEVIGAEVGVTNAHGPRTEYRAGQRVTADSWDEDFSHECSHGIHFFITREEAEAYA